MTAPPVKPRLRGVSHQWAFVASVLLAPLLVGAAETTTALVAASIFAGSVTAMFAASALFHRGRWSPRTRRFLRRLDHCAIYGLIAGTYTPYGLLVLSGAWRVVVLTVVWSGSLVAFLLKLFWLDAPDWVAATSAILLGWVGVVTVPQLLAGVGAPGTALLLAGGILYTLGGVVYARQRPDPLPEIFGFHEVFHACVIAAVALQYASVALFILPKG